MAMRRSCKDKASAHNSVSHYIRSLMEHLEQPHPPPPPPQQQRHIDLHDDEGDDEDDMDDDDDDEDGGGGGGGGGDRASNNRHHRRYHDHDHPCSEGVVPADSNAVVVQPSSGGGGSADPIHRPIIHPRPAYTSLPALQSSPTHPPQYAAVATPTAAATDYSFYAADHQSVHHLAATAAGHAAAGAPPSQYHLPPHPHLLHDHHRINISDHVGAADHQSAPLSSSDHTNALPARSCAITRSSSRAAAAAVQKSKLPTSSAYSNTSVSSGSAGISSSCCTGDSRQKSGEKKRRLISTSRPACKEKKKKTQLMSKSKSKKRKGTAAGAVSAAAGGAKTISSGQQVWLMIVERMREEILKARDVHRADLHRKSQLIIAQQQQRRQPAVCNMNLSAADRGSCCMNGGSAPDQSPDELASISPSDPANDDLITTHELHPPHESHQLAAEPAIGDGPQSGVLAQPGVVDQPAEIFRSAAAHDHGQNSEPELQLQERLAVQNRDAKKRKVATAAVDEVQGQPMLRSDADEAGASRESADGEGEEDGKEEFLQERRWVLQDGTRARNSSSSSSSSQYYYCSVCVEKRSIRSKKELLGQNTYIDQSGSQAPARSAGAPGAAGSVAVAVTVCGHYLCWRCLCEWHQQIKPPILNAAPSIRSSSAAAINSSSSSSSRSEDHPAAAKSNTLQRRNQAGIMINPGAAAAAATSSSSSSSASTTASSSSNYRSGGNIGNGGGGGSSTKKECPCCSKVLAKSHVTFLGHNYCVNPAAADRQLAAAAAAAAGAVNTDLGGGYLPLSDHREASTDGDHERPASKSTTSDDRIDEYGERMSSDRSRAGSSSVDHREKLLEAAALPVLLSLNGLMTINGDVPISRRRRNIAGDDHHCAKHVNIMPGNNESRIRRSSSSSSSSGPADSPHDRDDQAATIPNPNPNPNPNPSANSYAPAAAIVSTSTIHPNPISNPNPNPNPSSRSARDSAIFSATATPTALNITERPIYPSPAADQIDNAMGCASASGHDYNCADQPGLGFKVAADKNYIPSLTSSSLSSMLRPDALLDDLASGTTSAVNITARCSVHAASSTYSCAENYPASDHFSASDHPSRVEQLADSDHQYRINYHQYLSNMQLPPAGSIDCTTTSFHYNDPDDPYYYSHSSTSSACSANYNLQISYHDPSMSVMDMINGVNDQRIDCNMMFIDHAMASCDDDLQLLDLHGAAANYSVMRSLNIGMNQYGAAEEVISSDYFNSCSSQISKKINLPQDCVYNTDFGHIVQLAACSGYNTTTLTAVYDHYNCSSMSNMMLSSDQPAVVITNVNNDENSMADDIQGVVVDLSTDNQEHRNNCMIDHINIDHAAGAAALITSNVDNINGAANDSTNYTPISSVLLPEVGLNGPDHQRLAADNDHHRADDVLQINEFAAISYNMPPFHYSCDSSTLTNSSACQLDDALSDWRLNHALYVQGGWNGDVLDPTIGFIN